MAMTPSARQDLRVSILVAALCLVVSLVLLGTGLTGSAQAQADRGAIPSLELASDNPGQLTISWQAPEDPPTDYRIRWAKAGLSWLPWNGVNEAERGNEESLAGVTSLTLDNLTPGDTYKVQMRSRYYNPDGTVHESSGPWTGVRTQRVKDHPPAAPTGLTASEVEHDSLTLTWNDPQDANITGYRVLRGPDADNLATLESDTGSPGTSYTDSTLAAETSYRYAVLALSQDGDGAQSTAFSVTTPAAPTAPADPKSKDPTPQPQRVVPRQAPPGTTTLISNTGQGGDAAAASTTDRAQAFTTGSNPNGYTLSSVDIVSEDFQGDDATVSVCPVDTNDYPTGTCTALTAPGGFAAGTLTFTASPAMTLTRSTTYAVVIGTPGADTLVLDSATSDGEDSGGAAGWSIADNYDFKNSSNVWGTITNAQSLRITIKGTIVATGTNTPAAGAPAIAAPNVFRVPAVLTADLSGMTDTDGVTNIATSATYKWQRFAANGTTLETDSIGTGSTYTLTDADAGKRLKVVVNFTDDANNSEGPLTSAASSAITAAATDCNAPTLTGGAVLLGSAKKVGIGTYTDTFTYYGFSKSSGAGSLDNATFTTTNSSTHEILSIVTTTSGTTILGLQTDTRLSVADRMTVALHACDQAYPIASGGDPSTDPAIYSFSTSPQDWSLHAERTIYLSQDTTAPTFVSANVDGTMLVLTFSEDLGAAGSLAIGAFTVKKGTGGTPQTLSGTPSISDNTVTLTLADEVTASDTDVKVTYTKPMSGTDNKLVDKFGNETATFADQAVSTTTIATVPGAPTSLSATASGTTRINLSWTAPASNGGAAISGYKIEVSSDGGSNFTDLVANTRNTNTTYAHSSLAVGDTRHYRVSAINSVGTGPASNVASATTGQTTVAFEASSYTAVESAAAATRVTLELGAAPSAPVTIPLTTQLMGNTSSADYSGVPSSVTFQANQTRVTFPLRATNDDDDEERDEILQLGFGTLPSGYLPGVHPTATVTLVDDDGPELIVSFGTNALWDVQVREGATKRLNVGLSTGRFTKWGSAKAPDG